MNLARFWGVRLGSLALAIGGSYLLQMIAGHSNDYIQRLVAFAGLYVILAVSLNLINGITGQFSVGHAAFYQVGAYVSGYVSLTNYHGQPIVLWAIMMMVVGAAAAGIAGLIVGLPSLRLKGDYLAIVTLGFGEIIRIIVQNTQAVGMSAGFNVSPGIKSIALIWIVAITSIAVCRNLLKTAHGLPFLAVREDEVASLAMGVNITATKVIAFVVGSAFAGIAGTLLALHEQFLTPQLFGMDVSFIILTMVVLGGTGSITGSAVCAIFLSLLPELLRSFKGSDGQEIAFPIPVVAGVLIGLGCYVAAIRQITEGKVHTRKEKWRYAAGGLSASLMIAVLVSLALGHVPAIAAMKSAAGQLRMVIFSVTLIVVMLLRPQGIFAHHEFSWDFVAKLLGRKPADAGMGVHQ